MRQAPIRTTRKTSPARRKERSRLLGGASALAAAVMLLVAPQQASAQVAVTGRAFEANPIGATGVSSITRTDTLDTVQIAGSEAVITWRPIDTATSSAVIDILPVGNTLAFTGDGAYTVLNRVIPDDPTRAIQFNGGVVSLNGAALGGNVWFYSPGGIIAGPTSVFLVGGLVLTSSNMTGIGAGGNQMNFLGAAAGSRVEVQPGARLLSSDYMVLWAPRVVQAGGVSSGGNISYVGAEQGTLTVTGGLFNMVIDVGTDDPNGVVHTGITTGPTPVDGPVRAITLATVAKNDFVNMLVGGAIGYADASVATANNGVIVLSAANGAQPNSGNITIGPAIFNSTTLASASGDLTIDLDGQADTLTIGSATNESDFIGLAGRNLTINATSGATITAFDNFAAQAASPGQGGTLTVNIDDAGRNDDTSFSGLLVGGNLVLSAFGNGVDNIPGVSGTTGGNGVGGTIDINVSQGGELIVGGTTLLSAAGTAGFGTIFSGNATGGTINFDLDGNNSRVQLVGDALFDASANRSAPGAVNAGGEVDAGAINLALNAGSFTFGNLTLAASADADDSSNATGRFNGAFGGAINITNTARITGTTLTANALGFGGDGGTSATASDAGGDGQGGSVSLTNGVGGSLTLQQLSIDVSGSGGEGGRGDVLVNGARGGSGFGGDIVLSNAGTLAGNPTVTLGAAGNGGNGGTGGASLDDFNPAADGGAAGGGFGGTIDVVSNGATTAFQINSIINASGTGGIGGTGGEARSFESGNGGAGGFGQGGEISLGSTAGGTLAITAGTGTLTLDTGGAGGAGGDEGFGASPVGNPGQNGGSGGGIIDVLASGGALTINGNLVADATAVGNQDLRDGATGADSTGGTITTNASGGGALTVNGGLWLNASAIAAIGNISAGTGRGGTANMLMSGAGSSFAIQGIFPIAGFPRGPQQRSLYVDTSAYEPQSGNPLLTTASGGDTFGGTVNISFADGGSTIAGESQVIASAGRENPLSGLGPAPNLFPGTGSATGGAISITLANGTHQWNSFDATLETYAPGSTANDGTIRVLLDNATLDAGVGFSFSTTTFGDSITNTADVIVMRLINGSSLTTSSFTAFYTEAVQGLSNIPVTTGSILLELDNSTLNSDVFYTSIVPGGTGTLATGGTMGLSARNGSVITGDVEVNIFASGGFAPGGSSSRSGDINYLLDGSSHTGNLFFYSFGEGIGGVNSGDPGGQANGGNQNLSIINGSSFTGDMTLATFVDSYYDSTSSGALGDVDGGSFTLAIDGSTVDIGVLDVSFSGGADTAADGLAGANVAATDFSLLVTGSQVTIGDASIVLDAVGGEGGQNARGGDGTGGSILITSDALSSLVLNDVTFASSGTGGNGGLFGGTGGTGVGGAFGLFSLGDLDIGSLFATAAGTGGIGGAGDTGDAGGLGGDGQGGLVEVELSGATGVALSFGSLGLDTSATGGRGGFGGLGGPSLTGGAGGDGGSASGGTTRFRLTGAGANLTLDSSAIAMSSGGTGGAGGTGGINLSGGDGGIGGSGGDGTGGTVAVEAGSGSRLQLTGPSGGAFILSVGGAGGAGGTGGGTGLGGASAGDGGLGGNGTGGSPVIRAIGGEIVAPQLELYASGTGGVGGNPGGIISASGITGNGGVGTGGTPLLETLDGSPGVLTLGSVIIDASGIGGGGTVTGSTAGGQITITDASADPAGLITMGSLTVTAGGPLTAPGTPSLTIEGDSGPITVTGAVNADVAGDINFVFGGNGQLVVGGSATLNAGGDITLTHTGNGAGLDSLDIGTDLLVTAGGDFIAGAGSVVTAGRDISISAQNIQFASISAVRDLLLNATNGDITAVGLAELVAGRTLDLEASQAIAIGDAESDGSITLTAGTTVTTGNLTVIGADTIDDERIGIIAGGDVSLGTVDAIDGLTISGAGLTATSLDGQSVTATMTGAIDVGTATSETTIALSGTSIVLDSGDAPGNITLDASAGGIALGTINSETDLVATATGDISFGALTGRVVTLDSGGDITGGTAAADRNVVSGVSRNVNLTAVGDIAITSASAIADVVVRGASFDATTVTSGTGLNDDIDVLVSGLVDIGSTTSGGQTVLTGSSITLGSGIAGAGASVLTSTVGGVDLGTFDSENFLDVVSATTVDFDTLTARALSIDATGDVTGTRAAADVNLVSGRPRNVTVTTAGAITIDQIGAIGDIVLDGAALAALDATAGGNLLATVTGLADIGTIDTGGNATVSGGSVVIGDGVSGGLALITATAGDVDLGTWDAQGFFDIDADGSVTFDSVTGRLVEVIAGGDITGNFAASDVNLISGRPRNVTLDAGGAVSIGEARSIGNVLLDGTSVDAGIVNAAGTGTFIATGLVAIGDLTTGGATVITAGSADIGTASTAPFTANTTGAFAIDDLVTNGNASDVRVTAGGAITLGTIEGARIVRLIGASITGGTISAVAALDLDAGSVDLAGAASINGFITIDTTTGGVSVDDLDATTFGIQIDSAGDFSSLIMGAGGSIQIDAVGNASLGVGNAGGAIAVNAGGDITSGNLFAGTTSPGITLTAGGIADLADLTTNGLINVNATGALTGGAFASRGQITLRGSSIAITSAIASAVGGIAATSTTGGISADLLRTASLSIDVVSADFATIGSIESANSARVTTTNDATLGPVTATGGQVTLTIGGNLIAGDIFGGAASPGLDINVDGDAQLASVTSGSLLDIDVGGDLTGDVLQAVGNLTVDAASIVITSAASDMFGMVLRSTVGGVAADLLTAAGSVQVASATGASLGSLDAGANIDVTAGGTSTLGDATAGGNLTVTITGDLTSGALAAGATPTSILDLNVTGDADVTSAESGFILDVDVGGALTGGNFASGASTVDAGSIDVTRIAGTAGGGVLVNATTGDAVIGTVDSGGNARINALAGAANIGTLNAALLGEVIARSVTLDNGTIGGNLRLQATAGDIAGTGIIDVSGAIDLDATGNIGFGTLDARGGAFTADAGGDITFTGASSTDTLTMVAGGAIAGGDLDATNALSLTGNNIAIGAASAGSVALSSDTDIRFNLLSSSSAIDVIASNGLVASNGGAGDIDSGGDVTVLGRSIDLGRIDASGGVLATSTAGNLALGSTFAGADVTFSSAGDAFVDHLETTGSFAATTAGSFATGANSVVTGGDIVIDAGALVDLGNSSAGGLIAVTGQQIDFITLLAGQSVDLTTIFFPSAGTPGNGNITGTGVDAAGAITITAAGSTSIGGGASAGSSLTVDSAGDSAVLFATSGGNTSITGQSVLVNDASVGGDLLLDAFNGAITGTGSGTVGGSIAMSATGDVTFGAFTAQSGDFTVDAGGNVSFTGASAGGLIEMVAPGAINGGDLLAGGSLILDGGLIAIGDASATNISLTSATDILFNLLTSPNAISLTALDGIIGANTGAGDIDSGGDVTLLAQDITLNDVTSLGSVSATASAGDARFATVDAAGNITLDAAGTASLGTALSGGDLVVTAGGQVDLGSSSADGLIGVTGSQVDFVSLVAGTTIDIATVAGGTGEITGGSIVAGAGVSRLVTTAGDIVLSGDASIGGDLTIIANGGDITVASLTTVGDVSIFNADGALTRVLGATNAGNDVNFSGSGDFRFDGAVVAGRDLTGLASGPVGGDVTFGAGVDVGRNADVQAPNGVISLLSGLTGPSRTGGNLTFTGLGIELSAVDVGGDLALTATAGSLDATEVGSVGGSIALVASDGVTFGVLSAAGGTFTVDAGGNIVFDAAQSSDGIIMNAAGALTGGDLATPGTVSLDAARIAIGDATANAFAFASGSDILFDSIVSAQSLDLTAASGRIGGNTGPGDLTSGGDIALLAQEIALGTIEAAGSVTGGTSVGDMSFVRLASGGNIVLDSAGAIAVDHAEAAGDFTATAGLDFTTGSNSIVTGGDIVINAGGAVALGNSSAGGLIDVTGQQIDFDDLTADLTVSLQTVLDPQAPARGNGDITGQSITAGIGDSLVRARDGGDITIAGTVSADAVQVVANAGSITSGGLNTRLFAVLNASGAITLTGDSLGTNIFSADGASIDLGGSTISNGNVSLVARDGGVAGTGAIDADGELVVSATQSVSLLGDLVSASAIRIDGSSIALGNAQSAGGVTLRATGGGIESSGTITAGRDLTVDTTGGATLNQLFVGDDAVFTGSGDIAIARLLVTGDNPQSEEVGSNATFAIDGNVFVDHAEVADNLVAIVTSAFATGLNSIMTGGDILIDAGGPVSLGNSSAGGLVDVTGSQIDFATLAAGQTVTLLTQPSPQSGVGNGNITGTDLTAGPGASSVTSTFGSVAIGGQTTVAGGLTVGADADITLGTVAVQGGDLAATAGGGIALGSASVSGNAGLTAGGSITVTGDLVAGGTLTLLAQTGAIAARDLIASAVSATAAGNIGLRDITLSGGGASLVSGGDVALRDVSGAGASGVSITADGNLGFDDIVSDGGVSLLASNGAIDGFSVTSGDAVSVDGQSVGLGSVSATGDVFGNAESGALVASSITSTAGEVLLQGATAVEVAALAAATDVTALGGQVTVGPVDAGGDITLTSGASEGITAGALAAGGSILASAGTAGFTGSTLDAGADVTVDSGAGIAFDTIDAAGAANLQSTGSGTIAGSGVVAGTTVAASTGGALAVDTVSAGGAVNLNAAGGITLSTLVGSTAQLAAAGGEVRVTVEIDVPGLVEASGQSVFLRSTRNLAVRATATAGDIDILTEGDLDVSGAEATGGDVRLTSVDGVATVAGVNATATATGGNANIEAGENLNIAGAVSATNAIDLRAGERASIGAAVVGRDITLIASDVAIAGTGSLGTLDSTRSVSISGGGIARIGGDDDPSAGFVIDNDEYARIQASSLIAISASTAIILDDLEIRVANGSSATGNLRGEGRASFSAAEGIEVIGEVVMTSATSDNSIALSTFGDVFLDASTGLLEINDGSGTYLGLVEIEASNLYAMTEQARTDIQSATGIEAIDDRLAQNDGIDNPDGLIRTGTLDITTIASDVFIQNTAPGTRFEERRGFTVDELLISDPNGTNQPIVINGIIAGATGVDAVPLAQIDSTFDPGSTINGCLIANPSGCTQIPENLGEGSFPVQDLIEDQLDDDEAGEPGLGSGLIEAPLIELKDPLESSEDPLLDDPVTGAGNEDLWVGDQPQG